MSLKNKIEFLNNLQKGKADIKDFERLDYKRTQEIIERYEAGLIVLGIETDSGKFNFNGVKGEFDLDFIKHRYKAYQKRNNCKHLKEIETFTLLGPDFTILYLPDVKTSDVEILVGYTVKEVERVLNARV